MASEAERFLGVRSPQDQPETQESGLGLVRFNCPACDQSIEAQAEAVGQAVSCPTCQ
jgi:hypothetical protein